MPFAGVLPWLSDVWLDAEDTLEVAAWRRQSPAAACAPSGGSEAATAVERHRCGGAGGRAGCRGARHHGRAVSCRVPILSVLPGTRSTVSDLELAASYWACAGDRSPGATRRAGAGNLRRISDAGAGDRRPGGVRSAGWLKGSVSSPPRSVSSADKVLRRPTGTWRGHEVVAYEIHHGIARGRGRGRAVP